MTPNFIPHTKFHRASWYHEPGQCEWYWYTPRKSWKLDRSDSFYNSLDAPLHDIVKLLHKRGIYTTPSCAGHVQDSIFYENIWDTLNQQSKRIRSGGIQLVDPETKHSIQYNDPTYKLPWNKRKFVRIALQHGTIGCLGVYTKNQNIQLPDRIPGFITKQDGLFTIYLTKSDSQSEIAEKWNRFKQMIL